MIKKLSSLIKVTEGVPLLFILICIGAFIELLSFSSLIPIIYFFSNKSENQISFYVESFFEKFNFHTDIELILIISILIIFSIKFIYILFLTFYQTNFTANLNINLNNFFLKNYLNLSNKNKNNTAIMLRNIQNEVAIFVKSVFYPGLTLFLEFLILNLAVIGLLIYNFKATLTLIFIFLVLSMLYFIIFKKRFHYWGEQRQFHVGKQLLVILESLNLRKIINIYGIKDFFINKLNYHLNEQKKLNIKNSLLMVFPRLFLEFFFIFLISLVSIIYIISGSQLNDLFSILVVYTVIASRLFPAASRIAISFQSITTGKASLNVLFEEKKSFDLFSENKDYKKISFKDNIKFENLELSITNKKTGAQKILLHNSSLEISKNQFIGIVGKSGIGKTTLINYLSGFINADKSMVTIDGNKLENAKSISFLNIGIVTQEPLIFEGTIKENLFFNTNPKIEKEKIDKIIQIADLETFIDQSQLGLEMLIKEKGKNISGGQLQRICIARALIFNPNILILDEATSALDLETEKKILLSLKKIKDLTCIIVSHRQETLDFCDKIYEINNKNISLKKK